MLLPRLVLPLCALASTSTAAYLPAQAVLGSVDPAGPVAAARPPLKGRFIHLTDVHPDPFYRPGSSEDEACHFLANKKHKHKHGKLSSGDKVKSDGRARVRAARAGRDDDEARDGLDDDGATSLSDKPRTAGHWGLPISDCDSPIAHVNATFDWIEQHFKGEVDFVVWTGDNARHDIDSRLPRSLPEIFELNQYIVERVRKTFGKDVPVVASVGNNDVYPHNVMFPGPNKVTSGLLDIWKHIIPEHFLHTFARGGYYSVEAAGGDLLLVSLNTIYFYSRNTVVDGCPPFDEDLASPRTFSSSAPPPYLTTPASPASPEAAALFAAHVAARTTTRDMDPGTEQLLWLEQQLVLARARGMQVILTGHVPATESNWYEGCWTRYAELALGYQDTVVGQLFGHMNVDMFSFVQEADTSSTAASSSRPRVGTSPAVNDRLVEPFSASIVDGLHALYDSLPALDKLRERDYLPVHVNPSVIPTYLPGLRVWEYNTSRHAREQTLELVRAEQDGDDLEAQSSTRAGSTLERLAAALTGGTFKPQRERPTDPDRPPKPPRHSSPHAPARRNTYLSPLAYTQYYLPLSSFEAPGVANGNVAPHWEVEYTTMSTSELAKRLVRASTSSSSASSAHDPLFPLDTLPARVRALLASPRVRSPAALHALRRALRRAKLTPYDGVLSADEGLTVRAWVRAARWVVGKEDGRDGGKGEGQWEAYRERMGVGSGEL